MIDSTEFSGKVAIVTGAGQGMGYAVVRRLAEGGASSLDDRAVALIEKHKPE